MFLTLLIDESDLLADSQIMPVQTGRWRTRCCGFGRALAGQGDHEVRDLPEATVGEPLDVDPGAFESNDSGSDQPVFIVVEVFDLLAGAELGFEGMSPLWGRPAVD